VKAWEAFAPAGKFELIQFEGTEDLGEYLQGTRHGRDADPEVMAALSNMCAQYCRWTEEGWPDIGPLDNPLPDEVDCVVVGAGIAGINQANYLAESGASVIVLDKYHEIGGVWNFYGNDYSRVNTSEVGYRILAREGFYERPNEDHTPKRDIMRDISAVAAQHCRGRIHCNIEVLSADKGPDGGVSVRARNVKDGTEKTIKSGSVSFHVNRRIGKKRHVDWDGSDKFRGEIFYGYGNSMKSTSFFGKRVLVVGAGAFAFENVRTAIEHGARHVTLLGRRDGTTCPKWIDMIAFLRPLDKNLMTHRSGNMVSFEAWQKCYADAGLRSPKCWEEGLLKPNNHTISVSDVAFIAGFHGLFGLKVGEIKTFRDDGMGVILHDGSTIDCNIIIKCTGFHLNDDVPTMTGFTKMQPYGLLDTNLNYGAEPLLDGGQFSSAKDSTAVELDFGDITPEQYEKGVEAMAEVGLNTKLLEPMGNPFGSGQGGPVVYLAKFFTWLQNHPEEQKALVEFSGPAPQDIVNLWSSQIGKYNHLILTRLIAALGKLKMRSETAN